MIKIDTKNLPFDINFLKSKYESKINNSMDWILKKYNKKELGFVDLDENIDYEKINLFVSENKNNYDYVVVLWIWWSALWTRAIMTALKWKFYNELSLEQRNNYPKLYILDNVDPIEIEQLKQVIDYKKTLFLVISKSWWTLETISQFQYFKQEIESLNLDYKKHFVIIAWESSNFKSTNLENWLKVFDIPENVWGRFSVFTPVGLIPLAFIWLDIWKFLKWIKNLKESLFKTSLDENIALLTAIIQYHTYISLWKNITVFFPYISNFLFFWQWLKQLVWESLGKWWLWLTMVDAIWVTDQHSQLQLYYDGPNDKMLLFLELDNFGKDLNIVKSEKLSFNDLMVNEKYWTELSITEYGKINYTIKIDKLDEESLWELIFFFEFQTAILWELYEINAFNQPWVEIWKNITNKKLKDIYWDLNILNWKII